MKNLRLKPYFIKSLILAFSFCAVNLSAQENVPASSPNTNEEFVAQLKHSALLVRLQDKSKTILTLKEKGLNQEAEALANEQRRQNREILLSFSKAFDFCPVYFFYAKDSEAVRKHQLEGVVFNYNLEEVSVELEKFFTAEFAETPDLGIDGLIVKNQNLLPLESNLPFFERRFVFLNLIERSKAEMIESYNVKMHDYAATYNIKN